MVLYYIQTPSNRRRVGLYGRVLYDSHGRSSLLSLPEARKVLARVGGKMHKVDFGDLGPDDVELIVKHLGDVRCLIRGLESAEENSQCSCEDGGKCDNCPEPEPEVVSKEETESSPEEVVVSITPAQVENLAGDEEVDFPSYNEQRKAIAEADKDPDNPFNSKAIIGDDTGKEAIKRAFLLLQLSQKTDDSNDVDE